MRRVILGIATGALVVAIAVPALACMWDSDTLAMERVRFPDALELITGKFLRHSPEFYRWRAQDRTKRLEALPQDPGLYDDLAVAYEKLGDHQRAIETILRKEEVLPGLYETYANLGTFYILDGQFERGLEHVKRAIELNPDAHFGREIYQKYLIEYALTKQVDGTTTFPLDKSESRGAPNGGVGFGAYVLLKEHVPDHDRMRQPAMEKAVKGVLGMMRFANYDSPLLLEALGDLLLSGGYPDDGKRLAARAYLKASYEVKDASAQAAYRKLAEEALFMQVAGVPSTQVTLASLETDFKRELNEAKDWYAIVRADELQWIAEGRDADEEFSRKYYAAPQIQERYGMHVIFGLIASVGTIVAVGVVIALVIRRRRNAPENLVTASQ